MRVPVILESSDKERIEEKAANYGVLSFWKNHPDPLGELRRIMTEYVFGGFIFRTPRGRAVTEPIHDARVLAMMLRQMSPDIVLYHSDRNDFSRWLRLHGYVKTADRIKPWRSQAGDALKNRVADLLEAEIAEKEQATLNKKSRKL